METQLANSVIELDVTVLAFLAGTVIPLLTALITKLRASSGVKAVCNLVLSVIAGGVAHLIANEGASTWMELVTAMVAVYLASGVSYQNLWKPTGVTLKIGETTSTKGIGSEIKPEQVQVAPDTDQR